MVIAQKRLSAFIFSIILHVIVFFILILIEFQVISHKKNSSLTITLTENYPYKSIPGNETKLKSEREIVIPQMKEEFNKNDSQISKAIPDIEKDTSESKQVIFIPQTVLTGSDDETLKFAESLLDTFLILHPEYSTYVLHEKAKKIKENPDDRIFSKLTLEKRINDELHKYIRGKFPEGSQHEINKYAGPGINIPIGDLIDIIRKIF
jgi:hypothetical protein